MSESGGRLCSLQRGLEIVRADVSAWRSLSQYHYRDHLCGAVDKIFAIRQRDGSRKISSHGSIDDDRPIGVIVYAMPVPTVALRNRATNNRYVGLGDRAMTMRLLNEEIRCITRVVVQPQYRGIGLARWLVKQTLPQAGTIMVEALAVMGRVNPFFEQAGMTRYESGLSRQAVRLIAAFDHVGIEQDRWADPVGLSKAIGDLAVGDRALIKAEIQTFAQSFGRSGRAAAQRMAAGSGEPIGSGVPSWEEAAQLVAKHLLSNPVYYLWRRA